jgi:hypothetical protein
VLFADTEESERQRGGDADVLVVEWGFDFGSFELPDIPNIPQLHSAVFDFGGLTFPDFIATGEKREEKRPVQRKLETSIVSSPTVRIHALDSPQPQADAEARKNARPHSFEIRV